MLNNQNVYNKKQTFQKDKFGKQKPYQKPFLELLGDLRTLTLGYSGGVGDTGNPGIEKMTP